MGFFEKIDSIESKSGFDSSPSTPSDNETPITLNILIIPFNLGLLVSSASFESSSRNETGRRLTPRSFAVSKIPFIENSLFFDSRYFSSRDLKNKSRVWTSSVVVFSKSES